MKNGKNKDFDLESILELRDRALLMQHTASHGIKETPDNETEEE